MHHTAHPLLHLTFLSNLARSHDTSQFGTQVRFRWSRDRKNRTADNAFSAPWYFSEMEFEPAAG